MGSKLNEGTVVIAGASRGIGLALTEQFGAGNWRVIATARNPSAAPDLQALSKRFPNVSVIPLDIADSKSVSTLAGSLKAAGVETVDVLINNGAIGSPATESLETTTADALVERFRTNTVGVWEVTRAVRPFLKRSLTARIINISTIIGSISDTLTNVLFAGGSVAYRISKTALNELTALQAREYNPAPAPNLAASTSSAAGHLPTPAAAAPAPAKPSGPVTSVLAVHPGLVDTDMSNAGLKELPDSIRALAKSWTITPKQSAEGIFKLTTELASKPSPIAAFVDWTGKPLPW